MQLCIAAGAHKRVDSCVFYLPRYICCTCRIFLVDVPGAQQSAVAMGEPGIQLMDRDEYSLQVSRWAIAPSWLQPCMCTHCACCQRCAGTYHLQACLAQPPNACRSTFRSAGDNPARRLLWQRGCCSLQPKKECRPHPHPSLPSQVLDRLFNGFGGRLFNQIRSREGLAYSVSGGWTATPIDHPGAERADAVLEDAVL